jgi:hypothetical protein
MPADGDLVGLVAAVAEGRNREICVLRLPMPSPGPSGAWVALPDKDYVVIDQGAAPSRFVATLCHELAHMLLGHQGPVQQASAAALAPQVDPRIAARILGRHGYSDAQEHEAETLATVLAAEHSRRSQGKEWSTDIVTARLR